MIGQVIRCRSANRIESGVVEQIATIRIGDETRTQYEVRMEGGTSMIVNEKSVIAE